MRILTTRPIPEDKVEAIKAHLQYRPRDLALFTVALNTAFRASDLVSLTRDDLITEDGTTYLLKRERKTKKVRRVPLSLPVLTVLQRWLDLHPHHLLFPGQRGQLTVHAYGRLVKEWCRAVGLEGTYASHSVRKTWVRLQHEKHKVPLYVLGHALNHSSENQTRRYMGLLEEGVAQTYAHVL